MTLPGIWPRVLRLCGWVALAGCVYLLNVRSSPELGLGILYVIPVLLAAWHDGMEWGVSFALATSLLRLLGGGDRSSASAPWQARAVGEVAYLAVVGVAIAGLSQLRRTQAQLQLLATHDSLTGVLNARVFTEAVTRELGRNRRYGRALAVIYLDLDDFKAVNDVHGHATGDAVLRLVADAMRSAVRAADVVGRLGGDEFAVLMPETEGAVAYAAATRLANGIRTVFRGTPSVTASIGVVSVAATDAGSATVLRTADQAMYQAKRDGKDRIAQVAL